MRSWPTDKVVKAGHDRIPTFGAGEDRVAGEWHSIVRQLVATGFLRIDIQGYGGLALAEKGGELLKGEIDFRFRPDTVQRPRTRRASKPEVAALSPGAEALLHRLKELRLALAQQRSVPAYVIFSDKSLIDMSNRRPASREDFAGIFGVGEAKLDNFAEPFLAAIAEHGA
jgi:ATP-dependent DNA helicase RecQ